MVMVGGRQFFEKNFLQHTYNNKQNCRIWGSENSQVIEEGPFHSEKVTVWCALWPEGMIGCNTAKYMSKCGRKLPQKKKCLQHLAWR